MRAKWTPDPTGRAAALEALRKTHVDFPPLTLLLAREYFDWGWVGKTRHYLQRLNALFTDVAQAVERGALQAFFVDKEAMERELESARAW